jgi:hypothetical protein
MPNGWAASAGGFPTMAGNVPFLMRGCRAPVGEGAHAKSHVDPFLDQVDIAVVEDRFVP